MCVCLCVCLHACAHFSIPSVKEIEILYCSVNAFSYGTLDWNFVALTYFHGFHGHSCALFFPQQLSMPISCLMFFSLKIECVQEYNV